MTFVKYSKNFILPTAVLAIGIFLILVWTYGAVPYLKAGHDFTYYEAYAGKLSSIKSLEDELPAPTPIYVNYVQQVISEDQNKLKIFSTFVSTSAITNEVIWESNSTNLVDKNTGKYIDPPNTYFRFPPDTKKQNYLAYIYASGEPQPFVFEEDAFVNNLHTYKFSCHLVADLSDSYPEFSPNQVFSDYSCNAWIEPATGDEVYYEEKWTDYVIQNGTKIPVSIGNTNTLKSTSDILVERTNEKINLFYIYEKIIPLFLVLLTASMFGTIVLYQKQKQKISELRLREEKAAKLQTIGLLASRLAHDIRNPLSVIKATVEIMSINKNTDAESNAIARINGAISRISYQIDNVLDFVRSKPLVLEDADIATIVNRAIKSMTIPEQISVKHDLSPIKIRCDPKQLEVVFVNLIRNAVEALDGAGVISISAIEKGNFVHISVEDSGKGVPADIMDKIFEPLFTTKQTGTGLGLISCKNIVEMHGGKITVSSNPSIFTVVLPKNSH